MKTVLAILILLICGISLSFAQTKLNGSSWLGKAQDPQGIDLVLSWSFTESEYEMDLEDDGTIEVKGKYELEGEKIYLWDQSGVMACPKDQKGSYKIEIDGNKLNIELVADECPGRSMITPSAIWVRKE